jgi:hypothetical protein
MFIIGNLNLDNKRKNEKHFLQSCDENEAQESQNFEKKEIFSVSSGVIFPEVRQKLYCFSSLYLLLLLGPTFGHKSGMCHRPRELNIQISGQDPEKGSFRDLESATKIRSGVPWKSNSINLFMISMVFS